jgi:general stress protein YciG
MTEKQKSKEEKAAFMREIGAKGGKNSTSRPFRDQKDKARQAGIRSGEVRRQKRIERERQASQDN